MTILDKQTSVQESSQDYQLLRLSICLSTHTVTHTPEGGGEEKRQMIYQDGPFSRAPNPAKTKIRSNWVKAITLRLKSTM